MVPIAYSDRVSLDVVIPTYNDDHRLNLVLASLTRQTDGDFSVYVVNDGGADATRSLVESYADRLRVKYLFLGPETADYRLAAAKNVGWRAGESDRVLFMECDTVASPDVVHRHRASVSRAVMIGVRRHVPRRLVPVLTAEDLDRLPHLADRDDSRLSDPYVQKLHYAFQPMPWTAWYGCHISFPRAALEAVGGCNERFVGWGGDDDELAARVMKSGYAGYLRPDCVVYHLDHDPRGQDKPTENRKLLRETVEKCGFNWPCE